MRIQGIVLLQAAPEKEVMITKQESKNLSYEDYQDFLRGGRFYQRMEDPIGDSNHPVRDPARYSRL